MDVVLSALNRFGLGARPGERARVGDARAWLRAQLEAGPAPAPAPEGAAPEQVADALRALRAAARGDERARQQARQRLVRIAAAESRAALTLRATTARPFVERLVSFWSNHLCVSAGAKLQVAPLAGSYEREAIRPHVLGRFSDLVLASARHPAMLFYLDNVRSIGPASPAARRARAAAGARGLNENYARELLELHTLGVDGGYTQADVQALARMLTGWTVAGLPGPIAAAEPRAAGRAGGPLRFAFQPLLHEPGSKQLLGRMYHEAGGLEGERAILALCAQPATARFIAGKLARHFLADSPPESAVSALARAFQESGGDLRVVAETLVELPESWRADARKFRTPQDWLVAVLRALGAPAANDAVTVALRQLRQPLWAPPSPQGYGDTLQEWADPDALLNRAELARSITRRLGSLAPSPQSLLEVIDVAPGDPLHGVLADATLPAGERLALALAGPTFQWR